MQLNQTMPDLSPETTLRMLDLLPDPVLLVRLAGRSESKIAYSNQAARQHLRSAVEGEPLERALRQPRVLEAVAEAASTGAAVEVAFESIGVQPRFWRVLVRPLEGAGDALVLVMRDETDARRTERMRADFLANASHELRTPLASLAGFIETLRTHAKDDPEARDKFLGIMSAQAGRMARLVDDLLSLSRIELNEHIPPSGKVDLRRAAQDTLDASRPLAAERGVAVEIDAPPEPLRVVGDRDQLIQVIQNLLANALRYAPRQGLVRISLERAASAEAARSQSRADAVGLSLLSPDTSGGAYVLLRVADDGPGIARRHLPRLSERFYRVEGQKSDGTGLGLAITKHIVNRHRGGIFVESAEGAGTTFTVYLPAVA